MMEYKITTAYTQKALRIMAKALRKTSRKKHSRRSHIFGWIVASFALLMSLPLGESFVISAKTVVTWLVAAVLIAVLIWEDAINGYIAGKRMLPKLHTSEVLFTEEGYHSVTEVGSSDFKYDNITAIAETAEYFVFIFSKNHAQVYDKNGLESASVDEFRAFLQSVTGIEIQKI